MSVLMDVSGRGALVAHMMVGARSPGSCCHSSARSRGGIYGHPPWFIEINMDRRLAHPCPGAVAVLAHAGAVDRCRLKRSAIVSALASVAVVVGLGVAGGPALAQALDLDSAGIEKGASEVKAVNVVHGHRGASSHELSFGYGVSEHLKLGLHLDAERFLDGADRLDHIGLESQILLRPDAGAQPLVGWFTSVQIATDPSATNSLIGGPIVEFAWGPVVAVANTYVEKQFGPNAGPGVNVLYGWQLQFEVSPRVALAAEGFGTVPDVADAPALAAQDHRAGAMVYVGVPIEGRELDIGAGVLVGLTEAAPDVTLRLNAGVGY